ncbi:MAG: recombination protein RecR [Thermoleophilaceae bacterium]|nr:recombination protein RecR [Thermoleophilaceae bacterium]
MFSPPVEHLIGELSKLPGIGRRTAQRLAFYILRISKEDGFALADAIRDAKEKIGFCEVCFNFTDQERCKICLDARRDRGHICVVEEPSDIISLERTNEYHGTYHVLGGALSPIDGIDPEDLKIAQLLKRVEDPEVTEVLLATNPTTNGEATALYLADAIHARRPDMSVSRPASGLPVGADLEYTDEITLGRALQGRKILL